MEKSKVGRKKRAISEEMIADLHTLNPLEYMEKHVCSEKYYVGLLVKYPREKKSMFDGVVMFPEILEEKGLQAWKEVINEEHSKIDMALSDCMHYLELSENLSDEAYIELSLKTKDVLLQRRIIKDSVYFGDKYGASIGAHCALKEIIKNETTKDRTYKVRVLKEIFGKELKTCVK